MRVGSGSPVRCLELLLLHDERDDLLEPLVRGRLFAPEARDGRVHHDETGDIALALDVETGEVRLELRLCGRPGGGSILYVFRAAQLAANAMS